jgi:hypothetical protein
LAISPAAGLGRDVEGSTIKVIQGKTKAELWIPFPPAFQLRWQRGHARIW